MPANDIIVFPYGVRLRDRGMFDTFPVAEVFFPHKKGEWLSLFLVVDSGAAISALPKSDAGMFGVDAEKGAPMLISGVGGIAVKGWQQNIEVRLGTKLIDLPIVFLDDDLAPRILGRLGVFSRFTMIFEEAKKRSAFLEKSSASSRRIRMILNRASS